MGDFNKKESEILDFTGLKIPRDYLGETGDSARTAVRGGTTDTAYTTKAVVTVDNGGTLNVNAAHIYRSNGNGIRVQGKSKCTMNNGSINGLKPFKSIGGAVYVLEESTFNLKSGSITGNTCGGVTVNKGSIFNMTGGTIATNTGGGGDPTSSAVSYTHLTLPTNSLV